MADEIKDELPEETDEAPEVVAHSDDSEELPWCIFNSGSALE